MEFRCVKCLGNHYYKECPKQANTPPKCVNCKGDHPANFRGCSYFKKPDRNETRQRQRRPVDPNLDNSDPMGNENTQPPVPSPQINPQPAATNRNFANALRNKYPRDPPTQENTPVNNQHNPFIE